MNLDNLNITNNNKTLEKVEKISKDFIHELDQALHLNNTNNNDTELSKNINHLENGKTYVISGYNENDLEVLDITNGNEFMININSGHLKNPNNNPVYNMNHNDFLHLNIGDNITLKNGKITSNTNEVTSDDYVADEMLYNIYEGERESDGMNYKITDIKGDEIYLTNADGTGGNFTIHRELYPTFKVGNVVKREGRMYKKIKTRN